MIPAYISQCKSEFLATKPFVHTQDEALDFINHVGFCFLFPQRYELPSLWEVMCDYPATGCDWNDPISILIWGDGKTTLGWRDTLPKSRNVFFGKALAKKPSFVSIEYLPYFYACYGISDYIHEYEAGKMSHLAKVVYEYLVKKGPISTRDLKRSIEPCKQSKYRFDAALLELQSRFLIAKVDAVPGFCIDVWDIMERWMPEIIQAASLIKREQATKEILAKYLKIVVNAEERSIDRLFGFREM
jgi:hypothetical protein